jgi:hypothetical protein
MIAKPDARILQRALMKFSFLEHIVSYRHLDGNEDCPMSSQFEDPKQNDMAQSQESSGFPHWGMQIESQRQPIVGLPERPAPLIPGSTPIVPGSVPSSREAVPPFPGAGIMPQVQYRAPREYTTPLPPPTPPPVHSMRAATSEQMLRDLRQQIRRHEEIDNHRSLLERATTNLFFRSDERSLASLRKLEDDAKNSRFDDYEIKRAIKEDADSVEWQNFLSHFGTNVIKGATLFTPGKGVLPWMVAGGTHALAQMQVAPETTTAQIVADGVLGFAKGAVMQRVLGKVTESSLPVAAKGFNIGVAGGVLEGGLTRQNWFDKTGEWDIGGGIWNTTKSATIGGIAGTASFLAGDKIFRGLSANGIAVDNPLIANMGVGFSFGAASGFTGEALNQFSQKDFSAWRLMSRTLTQAAADTVGGAAGYKLGSLYSKFEVPLARTVEVTPSERLTATYRSERIETGTDVHSSPAEVTPPPARPPERPVEQADVEPDTAHVRAQTERTPAQEPTETSASKPVPKEPTKVEVEGEPIWLDHSGKVTVNEWKDTAAFQIAENRWVILKDDSFRVVDGDGNAVNFRVEKYDGEYPGDTILEVNLDGVKISQEVPGELTIEPGSQTPYSVKNDGTKEFTDHNGDSISIRLHSAYDEPMTFKNGLPHEMNVSGIGIRFDWGPKGLTIHYTSPEGRTYRAKTEGARDLSDLEAPRTWKVEFDNWNGHENIHYEWEGGARIGQNGGFEWLGGGEFGIGPFAQIKSVTNTPDGRVITFQDGKTRTEVLSKAKDTPSEFKLGNAIWRGKDYDQPVVVQEYLGKFGDRHYVKIENSDTGIPLDEIVYPGGTT